MVTLPWDPMSQIGNEWWAGLWGSSGDPAAACNTDISPTCQLNNDNATAFAHVKHAPPYLGGPSTYQLMQWKDGTATPVAHTDMETNPEETLGLRLLHTLVRRADVKCYRNSLQVTLDAATAVVPPVWTVKWAAETGVTVTSHIPEVATTSLPRNPELGELVTLDENYEAALALWHKRPPTVMGVGNPTDGMRLLVLWHEDSGPKLMLVDYEDWDEFAVQFDMPLLADADLLSECSYLQRNVTFHSPGNMHTHLGEQMWEGTTAHLLAVPGIAMEHYSTSVANLLQPDLCTFYPAP